MRKFKLLIAASALLFGSVASWAQDAGTYYIQNVSNGKWLGPGNNWGTQASVLSHGEYWKMAKISDGVYTLESVVSNGGTNYYLSGGWCDGGATNYTFAPVAGKENTYTIANSSGGYLTTDGKLVNETGTDATAEVSQWKLVTVAEMAATLDAANVDNPTDATFLITDHTFGRNNRYVGSWTNEGNCALTGGNSNKHCAEKYHGVYNVYQKLANAPVGCYKFTAQGFYRQDGSDNNHLPVFYVNTETVTYPLKTGSENSMADACTSFEAGKYVIDPIYVYVDTKGELTVGTKLETNTTLWCIWDNFELTYYGDCTVAEVLLADYVKAYNEAITEAQSFTEGSMFAEAWTALQSAISSNTLNLSSVTQEQLETATANLKAANAAATAAVKAKTVYDSAVALINGGTNVDLTSIVANASFEEGNLNGWTTVNGGAPANNNNWSKDGTWYVERWTANGDTQNHLSDGTLTHDALVLPAGLYTVTARAQNQEQKNGVAGTGYFLYANDEKVEITGTNEYSTSVLLSTDKSELVIKFALEGCTGNWISCDNIRLTYVGEDFPEYTLVTGKMNADVAAAQTSASEAFQANKNVANYNALTAAIAAAQASKDAYAAAATAIANAEDLQTKHNLASASAITTFADAIAAIKTPYENNTLTTDAANNAGASLGTVVTGWRAAANAAAVVYMNDGFALNAYDAALYVNTWSTEGEGDGSNFKVPFYEYFAGDGSALSANTWTGSLKGLENGLYEVSAWVRVRTQNAETTVNELTGITMNVNGGTAVDVTEGEQVGTTRFQLKEYTAQGLVKDGNLNLNFNINANNNIHWLSFKNVKYTKVRDLTPEEMAVIPTAIALKNGEDVVTEVALSATANTVTLTPAYEPNDATEGVTWTSSDETVATVANGVVTGVAPGTATITATSTLDENVKATVTVTVAYPESTVPAQIVKNNGATREIYTLGENIIKNGSFEYPNAYYGWTYGTGSTTAITSSKFNIINEGAADGNQYLQATSNEGGAAAGSLNTSWPIETNKTYVFGYKVKSSAASNGNQYLGTSLNTEKGQENGSTKMANPAYKANEWTTVEYIFESGDNTWLVFNARWLANALSFDDFYLAEAAYTLEGNVDYATAAIPTANIGDGAFQYSQNAINAANALVQGEATVDDVQNAYNALTTINEPAADQLFNVILTYNGWTYDQKAMTYLAGDRADMGGYNIKYQAEANQNLAQAFTFTKVSGNNYKMSQIDADGNVRYISTGVPYGGNNAQIRTTTDASKALVVTVIPTATEGVWNLKNTEANQYIGSQDAGVYTVNSHIDFNIVETTKPVITFNTTDAGYGTVMLPFAQALPEGVKAYTCSAVKGDDESVLELVEADAIEANKPYIIQGAWDAQLTGDAQGIALSYTDGWLTGVYAQTEAPNESYVLQKHGNKVGFYRVNTEVVTPQVGANRAYLTVSAAAGSRPAFFFGEDETTGINAIQALTSGEAEIYNAAGARIPTLQKGMNIVIRNGKSYKLIVK